MTKTKNALTSAELATGIRRAVAAEGLSLSQFSKQMGRNASFASQLLSRLLNDRHYYPHESTITAIREACKMTAAQFRTLALSKPSPVEPITVPAVAQAPSPTVILNSPSAVALAGHALSFQVRGMLRIEILGQMLEVPIDVPASFVLSSATPLVQAPVYEPVSVAESPVSVVEPPPTVTSPAPTVTGPLALPADIVAHNDAQKSPDTRNRRVWMFTGHESAGVRAEFERIIASAGVEARVRHCKHAPQHFYSSDIVIIHTAFTNHADTNRVTNLAKRSGATITQHNNGSGSLAATLAAALAA